MDPIEIDEVEVIQAPQNIRTTTTKRPARVPVDDAHPFDLEGYISSYSGRTVVERLIYLIAMCPAVAPQAYVLTVQHIIQGRDPSLYQQLLQAYDQANSLSQDKPLPSPTELHAIDQRWIDEMNTKNTAERNKLEVELKTYSSNMIKESIRMAHRDLGNFYRDIGDFTASLKHYTKSREFCTTSQHVLDMCISVLELLLEQRNYAHVTTYVFKADAALEAATGRPAGSTTTGKDKSTSEREMAQTKLDAATALSYLGQSQYEKAAQSFLRLGSPKGLEDWASKVISPSDIAIYTTLCVLATYNRSAIKSQLLEKDSFTVYIEQEPYVRELLEAYLGSRFKTVLELLERYSTRHYVDLHLSPHVTTLVNEIRNRALVLYFQPFQSIKLDRMATAFGWSMDLLEQQIVTLIQRGEIQARVDRQNKILKAKGVDQRTQLFARALKSGAEMQATNRKLLLRMRLQQAELVVKPPKGHQQAIQIMPRGFEMLLE